MLMSDFDMEDVTQRISITVQNNLKEGSIFVKNVALTRYVLHFRSKLPVDLAYM